MELQNSAEPDGRPARKVSIPHIRVCFGSMAILALFAAGCAAPGHPVTRQPTAPEAITDLAARQLGDSVILTFTLPKKTTTGRTLPQSPQLEIYREYVSAAPAPANRAPLAAPKQLIVTVPSQMEAPYREGDRIRFPDPLTQAELSAHAGDEAVYMARTRLSKHGSADSNLVALRIFPAPQPISDLRAQVTQSAIELSWAAPEIPTVGMLQAPVLQYRIYRAMGIPVTEAQKSSRAGTETAAAAFVLLGESDAPAYNDAKFTFGQAYEYSVRTVAQYKSGSVESEDSVPLEVMPRDTFPPAAPTGLVAAIAPANASGRTRVDLSWAISGETDVAGYNVYRHDAEAGPANSWGRLNSSLLLTPAFRDISAVSGKRYFYRVTAVDRYGNESAPSAQVDVTVPAKNE